MSATNGSVSRTGRIQTPRRIGRFDIVREIGRGEMGVVFEAVDTLIERSVAIKTFHFDTLPDDEVQISELFLREARSAGRLSHPHIVTIFDAGEAEGFSFIVMELLPGRSLRQVLEAPEPVAFDWMVNVAQQVADALAYAHRAGVVHRDIKPANIMVDAEGNAKLTDFSIAKVSWAARSQHGAVVGTPQYMSPEQVRGLELDGRSDVFSLGSVLFEALTGRPPFGGPDTPLISVLEQIVYSPAPLPSKINEAVPRALDMIVHRALAKEPAERYPGAADLARDLRQFKKLLMPGQAAGGTSESMAWLQMAPPAPPAAPAAPVAAPAAAAANAPQAPPLASIPVPAAKPLKTFISTILYASIVGFGEAPLARQAELKRAFAAALGEALRTVSDEDRMLIDTGDGAAVSLHGDPHQLMPVAMHIHERLRDTLRLRIGLHCGQVRLVTDVAGKLSLVGEGLSGAQRLVGAAQPGEALASRAMYDFACVPGGAHNGRFRAAERRDRGDGQVIEAIPVVLGSAPQPPAEAKPAAAPGEPPRSDLEDDLAADLDAFSQLSEAELLARTDHEGRMLDAGRRGLVGTGEFPRLVEANPEDLAYRRRSGTVAPAPEAPAESRRSGLLAQLAQQASSIQAQHDTVARGRRASQSAAEELLPRRMRETYNYLHELVGQLNIIRPAVARNYQLLGLGVFKDLNWMAGDSDFRTRGADGPEHINRINVTFTLVGPEALRADREGQAVEPLRNLLQEHGLEFDEDQSRNDRHRLERSSFVVTPEIRVRLLLRASYEDTRVILTTRNLDRFGITEYLLEGKDLGAEFLDELGKLILGQPNRFFAYTQPVNPLR